MINIEIIPNWHPVFVHFTIGLLTASIVFYLVGWILKKESLMIAARWNLWVGVVITAGTVVAGFHAYNTVVHDATSHLSMVEHRNLALATFGVFVVLALWSVWHHRKKKAITPLFLIMLVLASGLLATTGYKGGDLVYRYGLGVMSLPKSHENGSHEHKRHERSEHKGHHH